MVSLSLEERSSEIISHKDLSQKRTRQHMNGVGKTLLIDGFNAECKNISASLLKVGGDSMRKIRFRTTAKVNLPHLSYISVSRRHWGHSSRQFPDMLQGPLYLLESIYGRKGLITASTRSRLDQL